MMNVKKVNEIIKNCEEKINLMIDSKAINVQEMLLEQQVMSSLIDWIEEVQLYFSEFHEEEEEESEFNRLLYECVELQIAYNDENFRTLMNKMAREISKEIDDILQEHAKLLLDKQSMTKMEFNQKVYRLNMLQRKADNMAVDMICYVANTTFQDIENSTLNSVRALVNYRGGIYFDKVLQAIEELESVSTDELDGVKGNSYVKITDVKDMIELVEENGFEFIRQRGSHKIYANKNGKITILPKHGKKINKNLAYGIQKQIKN